MVAASEMRGLQLAEQQECMNDIGMTHHRITAQ